jgi:hypothetical protein
MDAGSEPIADPDQLRDLRRQARIVHAKSLAAAAAVTALLVSV